MRNARPSEQSIAVIEPASPTRIAPPMPPSCEPEATQADALGSTAIRAAAASHGDPEVLVIWLRQIAAGVVGRLRGESEAFALDLNGTRERIRLLEARLSELTRHRTALETGAADGQAGVPATEELERLRKEIGDLSVRRATLEAEHWSPRARVGFVVKSAVLVLLSAYLYLFYVNVGHAAFSRNLGEAAIRAAASGDLTQLFDTFFDPRSFLTAVTSGNLLLLLFPFVFIAFAVGFHHALESEKGGSWKAAGLGTATLAVDVLLAYLISRSSHDIQVLTGLASGAFGPREAITEPRFWIVIFLGIVVAVLWGLLYGSWMSHFSSRAENEIGARIREKEAELQRHAAERERRTVELGQRIAACKEELTSETRRFAEIEEKGKTVVVSWDEIERRCLAFLNGWVSAISALAAIPLAGSVSPQGGRFTAEEARRVGLQTIESMKTEQRAWVN